MFCEKCGSVIDEDVNFCKKCGNAIKEKNIGKIVFGLLLLAIPFLGGTWRYIFDWSTGDLQTFNEITILLLFCGVYLIVRGFNQETDSDRKVSPEKIKSSWKRFNWLFWILLYLFATINGFIYRFTETGYISRESGLGMASSAEHIILPLLMVALLYITVSIFCSKKLALGIASMGLIMSYYVYSEIPFNISYALYCFILGAIIYGVVWHYKNKA